MAVIAQLVARKSHNPKVVDSIITHRIVLNGCQRMFRLCTSIEMFIFLFLIKNSAYGNIVDNDSTFHTEDQGIFVGHGLPKQGHTCFMLSTGQMVWWYHTV
jgi:hypothetical protein